ncbi:MAG: bifunctional 3-deoxy-7-phosphoheptulonate synthase/chorismate mutase type II [Bacteroidota bacterium]
MKEMWRKDEHKPWLIAGPCSAESFEQLRETVLAVHDLGITTVRAGIWKPRTRPNNFEGVGKEALSWIQEIKQEIDVQFAIEVASSKHVDLALKNGIDIVWIGARTSVNPFSVQEIAEALQDSDIPVLIKNPINPDPDLWMGGIERLANVGLSKVGAIHRGFSAFKKTEYRNQPLWQIAIELKRSLPHIPLICDPSHIGGDRSMIFDISQKALDLRYDGLMIETHPNPPKALSDPKQQVTPGQLKDIVTNLQIRNNRIDDVFFQSKLDELRNKIDSIDHDIIENLTSRMKLIEEIGDYKEQNNVAILQIERWSEILRTRKKWSQDVGLSDDFIEDIYTLIHADSIKRQTEIFNKTKK